MSLRLGPSRTGQPQQIKHPPPKNNPNAGPQFAIVVDSDSEPEVIMVDADSDSDIEFMGFNNITSKKIPLIAPSKQDEYSDEESIPEGFELWEPTKPLKLSVRAIEPKCEAGDNEEPELAWNPPTMSWMHEYCTGTRSAGAFIETKRSAVEAPASGQLVGDYSFGVASSRPSSAHRRSRYGAPTRETINYFETSFLYSRAMTRIPGLNTPRGAVNFIAQTRGYVAVGRTHEEEVVYDGGGLVLWKVKDQKARDIPAHVTESHTGRNPNELDPERRQHSVATLAFDPASNLTLLSAGHDNTVQQWLICEETDTVECVGSEHVRKPGYMEYHPNGGIAAIGCADGLRLFNTTETLEQRHHSSWKRKGHETVSAAWGTGRSSDTIVAGTQRSDFILGRLMFIDANVGRSIVSTESEACSTLSVDPTGTITAFTGSGRGGNPRRHILRLYDVQRSGWQGTSQIGIPSSKTEGNGEVIVTAWSPDGVHLACARDDDSVDVFDIRWLGQKQCMLVFKHDTGGNTVGDSESYGVQGLAWFGSEKLVSGGADHCVRLWDVRRDESCYVLATLSGGVGCLIGSENPELFPIIAGDLLGNTYYLPNPQLIPGPQ